MKKGVSLLCCTALAGLFSITAFAQADDAAAHAAGDTGTYGSLSYTINEDGETCSITACDTNTAGSIEIPSEIDGYVVTEIGDGAFAQCNKVTGITIPASVNTVGWCAFTDCVDLTSAGPIGSGSSIEFGWTETIPVGAFSYCMSLTHVTIPASVTNIGGVVFNGCDGLTSAGPIGSGSDIEFGWTEEIPDHAFQGSALTEIIFPDGVKTIGDYAFDLTELTEIVIPDTVTSIGTWAFYNCNDLVSVTIPASVTECNGPFSLCDGLTSAGPLGSGCSIEFGWTEEIPAMSFWLCEDLKSVIIPDGVKCIGDEAFSNCTGLETVTIPESVTSIGQAAFDSGSTPMDVYYGGSESQWKKVSILFGNWGLNSATIHYGKEDPALPGDVNGDEKVGAQDLTLLCRYLLEGESAGGNVTAADMNTDGRINMQDLTLLCRAILEQPY